MHRGASGPAGGEGKLPGTRDFGLTFWSMSFRTLPLLLALTVAVLWPQSLVVCIAEGGHIEFELSGAPGCPEEEGGCQDCHDKRSPDLRPATVPVVTAPIPPIALPPESFAVAAVLVPGAPIEISVAAQFSVVLLI